MKVLVELQGARGLFVDQVEVSLPAACDSDIAQQLPKVVLQRGKDVYTFHVLAGTLRGYTGIFRRRKVICV